MARQTPQQKRANAGYSKQIEKNMGRPQSAIKKKDAQKSPIGTPMLGKSPYSISSLRSYCRICVSGQSTKEYFLRNSFCIRILTDTLYSPPRIRGGRNSWSRIFWDWRCALLIAEGSIGEGRDSIVMTRNVIGVISELVWKSRMLRLLCTILEPGILQQTRRQLRSYWNVRFVVYVLWE